MWNSPRSGSRNDWTRIKNVNGASSDKFLEFFRRDPNNFLSGAIGGHGRNLVISVPMTRRQANNQWSSGIAAHTASPQKIPSAKIRWKIFCLFLGGGIKTASSSLIIFQRAKLSKRSIKHFCWCNWMTFWKKNAARGKVTMGVLFLHDNAPAHRTLAPQKKLAYLDFQCLDHPPYSPYLTCRTTTCSLEWKNNWKVAIFLPTLRSLLPRRSVWTDNFLNFFLSGLQKLEQQTKKCIELREEYVE